MAVFLGIDIGTSKICVLALDKKSGKPLYTVSVKNNSTVRTQQGFSEQNPAGIMDIIVRLLRSVRKNVKRRIHGIGLTGQMHGMLFVDKNLKPLSNLITWQDRRSEKLIPEIHKRLNKFSDCGCLIQPGYMAATLYWFKKKHSIPKDTYKAVFINDWIGACLTEDKNIFTDPTDAAGSGVFDIRNNDWHWPTIDRLGLNENMFPEIRNAGEITGFTKEGIPIGCACGDNQASIFGSMNRCNDRDYININIGTGSQISIVTDTFTGVKKNLELRPYFDKKYIVVGASLNGGSAYALLKDYFVSCNIIPKKIKQEEIFTVMNRHASSVSRGCDGITCEPYFYGERSNPGLKPLFTGLNDFNCTPGHLCRAVLEGIVRILYDFYRDTGRKRRYIIGSGNAIRKNRLLQEIIKKTFNMQLKLTQHEEEAAYGAALIAERNLG